MIDRHDKYSLDLLDAAGIVLPTCAPKDLKSIGWGLILSPTEKAFVFACNTAKNSIRRAATRLKDL